MDGFSQDFRRVDGPRDAGYVAPTAVASGGATEAPVGRGAVADLFYAGRYHDVLAATADSPRGYDASDAAFAVGALAFSGRLVEAEALFESFARGVAPRTRAAGAFFVCVALCRVGRLDEARARLAGAARSTAGARDAWARSLLLQGAACVRYFSGRLGRAASTAGAALRSALRAGFPYGQMLANDLRGHALAQAGRVAEGLRVLRQARDQAARLGYAANAHVIDIAIALHRARGAAPAEAEAVLARVADAEAAQDSYSRRTLLVELAVLRAWMGRAAEAARLVDEAEALCAGEPRQQAWIATARAHVARVREGAPAALAALDEAARLTTPGGDPARRIEVAGLRLALARAAGDGAAAREAALALRSLHAESGLRRARQWLDIYEEAPSPAAPDGEAMTPLLAAVARGSAATALRAGLLGLVPEALGLAPARRLHVFEGALLVEDRGDLRLLAPLGERAVALLAALGAGHQGREALLGAVWGLRGYAPDRHDTLIKTAVSRLRAHLGDAGAWVLAERGGYRLADGVEVARHDDGAAPKPAAPGAPPPPADVGRNERQRRIVEALRRTRRATVSELARVLREPVRTVSRELSTMCGAEVLAREGAGRATAYRLREAAGGEP